MDISWRSSVFVMMRFSIVISLGSTEIWYCFIFRCYFNIIEAKGPLYFGHVALREIERQPHGRRPLHYWRLSTALDPRYEDLYKDVISMSVNRHSLLLRQHEHLHDQLPTYQSRGPGDKHDMRFQWCERPEWLSDITNKARSQYVLKLQKIDFSRF